MRDVASILRDLGGVDAMSRETLVELLSALLADAEPGSEAECNLGFLVDHYGGKGGGLHRRLPRAYVPPPHGRRADHA